jgi:hypothetical protein
MTNILKSEKFEALRDYDTGRTFHDYEFSKCSFSGCIICAHDPLYRSTVRNVELINCETYGSMLFGAVVEDVSVDGLETHGGFDTWATVFKHVVLKGRVGRSKLHPLFDPTKPDSPVEQAFREANVAYYAQVDWALDLSQGEFEEADIRGIPARLIRRDPATQVVVTREKAVEGRWKNLDLSKTYWQTSLAFLLSRKDPDVVLVAPKADRRHYRDLLDGLKMLRDAGVAEPH